MEDKELSTEEKILEAAQKVFQVKGMAGARMQEIADEAGINKALLHYYFRTKEKLFNQIFKIAAGRLFPKLVTILTQEVDLETKIRTLVTEYITFIQKHPFLPMFILSELSGNAEKLISFISDAKADKNLLILQEQIDKEVVAGKMKPIRADHLIVNVLGLIIFPFAAKPIIQFIMGKNDDQYKVFIEERKTMVAEFVLSAIRV